MKRNNEAGQSFVEYALILVLIAVVVVCALIVLGSVSDSLFITQTGLDTGCSLERSDPLVLCEGEAALDMSNINFTANGSKVEVTLPVPVGGTLAQRALLEKRADDLIREVLMGYLQYEYNKEVSISVVFR